MCVLRETVKVVDDDELGVAWAAATSSDGRRVVFVRQSDQHLLVGYCARGIHSCPIFHALVA